MTRLSINRPVVIVKGKLKVLEQHTTHGEKARARTWHQWSRETVKNKAMLRLMNQRSHDDIKWIISFKVDQAKC
jgi:hypothetical protein